MKHSTASIDKILVAYKDQLGKDFKVYRNHVYRVYHLCLKIDGSKENEEKYAIAASFHDIGIWTNNTFDYLEPSIKIAADYLRDLNKSEWIGEIALMIDMHHKRSKYQGEFEKTVETFRRADWIDVLKGRKLFHLKKSDYSEIKDQHPILGFHKFLLIQSVKNFFKSPLNPLPMFKK